MYKFPTLALILTLLQCILGNGKYSTGETPSCKVSNRSDANISEGSKEDFPQSSSTNCELWDLRATAEVVPTTNTRTGRSKYRLDLSRPHHLWFCSEHKKKQLVLTSHSRESRLPLYCNWRHRYQLLSAHTQAVIERTWRRAGSGPKGSQPTST